MSRVCVIGSCNIDTTICVDEFSDDINKKSNIIKPQKISLGGKGANQAVACSRLGNDVLFIGCVGNDENGKYIINRLQKEGINISCIEIIDESTDGRTIYVKDGENRMFGTDNAIEYLVPSIIEKNIDKILMSDIVMIQLKMPEETIKYIIEYCYKNNKKIIVTPAPENKIDILVKYDFLDKITYITLNCVEGIYLAEMIKESKKDIDCVKKKNEIKDRISVMTKEEKMNKYKELVNNQHNVIVTLGEKGAMYYDENSNCAKIVNSYKTKCIDDTGAGDTFNGAFVSAYLEDVSNIEKCIDYGNKAASIKVGFACAQAGMPTKKQINEKFKYNKK